MPAIRPHWLNTTSLLLLLTSHSVLADELTLETIEVQDKQISEGLNLTGKNSTSNRLGLTAMELPGSLETITESAIDKKADYTPLFAVTRATGISSTANPGNGGTALSARGFTGHNAVVQTFDGTRLYVGAGTVTFPADSWTLEKIEILRGPSSVIHGIGALGATINYIPKKPTFSEIQQEVEANTGSDGLYRLGYGSGGQLSEQTAYRFDVLHHESDGYVDHADEERQVFAGSLLFRPQDNLDITLSLDYSDIDASPYWGTPLINDQIQDSTRSTNYNIEDGIVNYKDFWPRLNVQWQINESTTYRGDTYYLSAERHWRNVESYSFRNSQIQREFFLEILHDQDQIGHRSDVTFDFASSSEISHRLNLGLELNQIDFTHTNNRPYRGEDFVDIHSPDNSRWNDLTGKSPTDKDFTSDTFQYAVFADHHLTLNPQVSVVTGLRYDNIDLDRQDFARLNNEQEDKINHTLSGTSWRLGVVYQPQENTSLYGQMSRSVGSIQSILSATNSNLKLATGKQLEVGIKQIFWNQKAQYTLAVFDIELEDFLDFEAGGVQHQVGQQSSQGIELEWFVQPSDQVDTTFNITWLDAEFDEYNNGDDDLSGNKPRNIPKTTANLWVDWRFVQNWELNAGARYVGKRYTNNENNAELPSYTVYDAGLRWKATPNTTINLRGKNILDEKVFVLSSYGSQQWVLGPGRQVEIGVNYSF